MAIFVLLAVYGCLYVNIVGTCGTPCRFGIAIEECLLMQPTKTVPSSFVIVIVAVAVVFGFYAFICAANFEIAAFS